MHAARHAGLQLLQAQPCTYTLSYLYAVAQSLAVPTAVRTLFNVAPGQAGLGQEFFEATDILCLNESEVG